MIAQQMPIHVQAATFADINSDGILEVLCGTSSGKIYALNGHTGEIITPYPFQVK